ncbi:MAG: PLP-dependent aminotransferase family protein [Sulfitobacter sp.]
MTSFENATWADFMDIAVLDAEVVKPFRAFDITQLGHSKRSLDVNPIRALLSLLARPEIISFAGGIPDPQFFPRAQLAKASTQLLVHNDRDVLQYGQSTGDESLRAELASYMRSIGVPCDIENILITTGAQQSISMMSSVLCSANRVMGVQDISYLGALQDFRSKSLDLRSLKTGDDADLAAAYVIPDFCNPTGQRMAQSERLDLVHRAERHGFAIIEDGAYTELYFDGTRMRTMLELDCELSGGINNARTLFCGTMSKTLSPGLRVGWVCGPRKVIALLGREKECCDIMTSPFSQALVDTCLKDGLLDAQTPRLRAHYKNQCDTMCAALDEHVAGLATWDRPDGGLFVWLTLPEGVDADDILKVAIEQEHVAFIPGQNFQLDRAKANCLRLSFSSSSEASIEEGVSRLARVLQKT